MFERFSSTFRDPWGEQWFRTGLLIVSARPDTALPAIEKLQSAFPGVAFDLVVKAQAESPCHIPGGHWRYVFPLKRAFGGLRLLLHHRDEYDLVVLFATGERVLSLCRACALLWVRPRRFFVFNEFGDGFWLHRDDKAQIRGHFERRYNWEGKRWRLRKIRDRAARVLRPLGIVAKWLALLPYRVVLLLGAALFFLPALLLILLLRATYSTRTYRFRLLAGLAPARHTGAPEAVARALETALQTAASATLPVGHSPTAPAGQTQIRRERLLAPQLRAERLVITGVCDGLAWTPGSVRLNGESYVSLWVEGLPHAADVSDVNARLNGVELEVEFVAPPRSAARQVNARLPESIAPGKYPLLVSLGDTQSPPFTLIVE